MSVHNKVGPEIDDATIPLTFAKALEESPQNDLWIEVSKTGSDSSAGGIPNAAEPSALRSERIEEGDGVVKDDLTHFAARVSLDNLADGAVDCPRVRTTYFYKFRDGSTVTMNCPEELVSSLNSISNKSAVLAPFLESLKHVASHLPTALHHCVENAVSIDDSNPSDELATMSDLTEELKEISTVVSALNSGFPSVAERS